MARKIKAVFDTNIFISAIIYGGNPRTCLELARIKEIKLITSRSILLELARKLKEKFEWENSKIADVVEGIGKFAEVVEPNEQIDLIRQDPEDNRVLECAKEGKANYIISGDKKHILSLKQFKGIEIVSAQEFLGLFYKKRTIN